MDVTPTNGTTPAPPPAGTPAAGGTMISSDFQTFLRMMTTQLQNQDPLNPIDSADYAVQLATFSGVEQQARTNQILQTMQTQMGLAGLAQLSGWVGQEGRVGGPVRVDGKAVTVSYRPASGADRVVLSVNDANGTLIAREELEPDGSTFLWTPRNAQGQPLADGSYSLTVESYSGEDLLSTDEVEHYALIREIRLAEGAPVVVLPDGREVPADQVTAIRTPPQGG
ncbi:flagellar basal body rod modification protein [Aliigemmobacter aestuarii]|uniref:Basal-body rod modification protein FlgD n=1 Tax=Aliigemmobacter aestuarii TaxID=1445661 RepID=A0A4S3MSS1_9RHOB|nr:flagellar hook capping FlgD N-terminal domain-containing protein [Gemmobacter aestuarii]THD85527.1 flagellar basal body rod modification protein [Gemmobacter aestuarii]